MSEKCQVRTACNFDIRCWHFSYAGILANVRYASELDTRFSYRSKTLPDGQITSDFQKSCQAPKSKIFLFSPDPNQMHIPRRPDPHRGAFRDRHGRWAWDAVDARASGAQVAIAGRDEPRERSAGAQDDRRFL